MLGNSSALHQEHDPPQRHQYFEFSPPVFSFPLTNKKSSTRAVLQRVVPRLKYFTAKMVGYFRSGTSKSSTPGKILKNPRYIPDRVACDAQLRDFAAGTRNPSHWSRFSLN